MYLPLLIGDPVVIPTNGYRLEQELNYLALFFEKEGIKYTCYGLEFPAGWHLIIQGEVIMFRDTATRTRLTYRDGFILQPFYKVLRKSEAGKVFAVLTAGDSEIQRLGPFDYYWSPEAGKAEDSLYQYLADTFPFYTDPYRYWW